MRFKPFLLTTRQFFEVPLKVMEETLFFRTYALTKIAISGVRE
jgi:hypothetical protein